MRIVTRGDLDGLISSVLLSTMEDITGIELIHPQHITDSIYKVASGDILVNVPYHPSCAMWFDHHTVTESNLRPPEHFKGYYALLPSTARVIMDHYGPERLARFKPLVSETDRFCSARLERSDIESPEGVVLLGFLIDPRTNLGAYKVFFKSLVERLRERDMEGVLADSDVAERIDMYRENGETFKDLMLANSREFENVVITDFRGLDSIPVGNRFVVYSLYPDCNVSIRLQWGPQRRFVAATIGKSIFNRTCDLNIGDLCSDFGGGGHQGAGSCPLEPETANEQVEEIVQRLVEGID